MHELIGQFTIFPATFMRYHFQTVLLLAINNTRWRHCSPEHTLVLMLLTETRLEKAFVIVRKKPKQSIGQWIRCVRSLAGQLQKVGVKVSGARVK